MLFPAFFIIAALSMVSGQLPGLEPLEDMTKCPEKTAWKATLDSVEVENCPDRSKPCNLVKGHNYTIAIQFKTTEEIKSVKAHVKGIVAGLPVDYQVPQPDACKESGLECPLQPEKTVTYRAVLPVKPIYPSISLKVRWALIDEQKHTLVCVMIPVRISNKSPAAHH